MNYSDTEQLLVEAVQKYYEGDASIFFQYLHPEVVVLSSGKEQLIMGKNEVTHYFDKSVEAETLHKITGLSCKAFPLDGEQCYCVLQMNITTFYKDGHMAKANQRMTVIWTYQDGWLIRHLHISIATMMKYAKVEMNRVSNAFLSEMMAQETKEKKICIKGVDGYQHYILPSQIIHIEAERLYTHIYMIEEDFVINKILSDTLEELQNGMLLRIHKSHVVNVWQISAIKNYKATMKDGTEIPISRVNYSEMKEKIRNMIS